MNSPLHDQKNSKVIDEKAPLIFLRGQFASQLPIDYLTVKYYFG